jgi:hypothetical protein
LCCVNAALGELGLLAGFFKASTSLVRFFEHPVVMLMRKRIK